MPLIRDLIAIPERVHQGDFVLKLTEGVTEPQHHLGAAHQPVDQRHHARRVGEHLAPFGEGAVVTTVLLCW